MINIILLTYQRTEYALRTVRCAKQNLRYDGEIKWIMVDDGSRESHVNAVAEEIGDVAYRTGRNSYGGNANWAWERAQSDVTLWLEDDWELRNPLDITPYVNLLRKHDDIGMVRLGLLPIDLKLYSIGRDGIMYLDVSKESNYAFSGNPHLKHKRFQEYGLYPEGLNPGQTEIAYDYQIRHGDGFSKIVWPVDVGSWGAWSHIGESKSYE